MLQFAFIIFYRYKWCSLYTLRKYHLTAFDRCTIQPLKDLGSVFVNLPPLFCSLKAIHLRPARSRWWQKVMDLISRVFVTEAPAVPLCALTRATRCRIELRLASDGESRSREQRNGVWHNASVCLCVCVSVCVWERVCEGMLVLVVVELWSRDNRNNNNSSSNGDSNSNNILDSIYLSTELIFSRTKGIKIHIVGGSRINLWVILILLRGNVGIL